MASNDFMSKIAGGCLALCIVGGIIVKCSQSDKPVVTLKEEYSEAGSYEDSNGKLRYHGKMYKLYDSNKVCDKSLFGGCFMIIKEGSTISPSDKCYNCGYTWKKHDDA